MLVDDDGAFFYDTGRTNNDWTRKGEYCGFGVYDRSFKQSERRPRTMTIILTWTNGDVPSEFNILTNDSFRVNNDFVTTGICGVSRPFKTRNEIQNTLVA